jgi:two-component sensor histidine kinase
MLVEGNGKIVEKGSVYNGKYLRLAPSDAPNATIMIYVSNFHHLYKQFDFDVLSIGDEVSVKGIMSEYNPDYPAERTFKVFLRTPEDLQYAGLPRYYLFLTIAGLILLTLVVIGWIVMLRRQVDKKTEEIQKSLDEKEILLREIHHRVKNSLGIVSGLIGLQVEATESDEAQSVLQDSQSRIQSVALIHEKLYLTKSLSDIELGTYLKELVETIHSTFTEYNDAVDLRFDLETVEIDVDKVIPCGLLINELVVNAFKHAFDKEKQGILEVKLHKKNGDITLAVADNGPGVPEDFDLDSNDSLGLMLLDTFAAQLDAQAEIKNGKEGAVFSFTFSAN